MEFEKFEALDQQGTLAPRKMFRRLPQRFRRGLSSEVRAISLEAPGFRIVT